MFGWNPAYYDPKGDSKETSWEPKCDCGAEKTYGKHCYGAAHYDWCAKKTWAEDQERRKKHEEKTRYR